MIFWVFFFEKTSEVSKRGWRTEGVGARKSFICQRFRPLSCTLFPMPPEEKGTHFWRVSLALFGGLFPPNPSRQPLSKPLKNRRKKSTQQSSKNRKWGRQTGYGNHPPIDDYHRNPIRKFSIDCLDASKTNEQTQPQLATAENQGEEPMRNFSIDPASSIRTSIADPGFCGPRFRDS